VKRLVATVLLAVVLMLGLVGTGSLWTDDGTASAAAGRIVPLRDPGMEGPYPF